MSPRRLAHGYVVDVQGAVVTSAPCARHLTLEALPKAAEVSVTVRAGSCGAGSAMEGAAGQVSAAKHDAGAKRAPSASLAATGFDSQAPTAAGVLALAVLLRAVFARMRRGGER